MNRIADNMNCDVMLRLAKKHQDENRMKQDYGLIPEAYTSFNTINDVRYLPSMDINPKHCIYKRDGNNMDWWDALYMSPEYCVPDNMMMNTKNKVNTISECSQKPLDYYNKSNEYRIVKPHNYSIVKPKCFNSNGISDRYNNHIIKK